MKSKPVTAGAGRPASSAAKQDKRSGILHTKLFSGAHTLKHFLLRVLPFIPLLTLFPGMALAASGQGHILDLTQSDVGFAALAVFVVAYIFVMAEEFTHLRKS